MLDIYWIEYFAIFAETSSVYTYRYRYVIYIYIYVHTYVLYIHIYKHDINIFDYLSEWETLKWFTKQYFWFTLVSWCLNPKITFANHITYTYAYTFTYSYYMYMYMHEFN